MLSVSLFFITALHLSWLKTKQNKETKNQKPKTGLNWIKNYDIKIKIKIKTKF